MLVYPRNNYRIRHVFIPVRLPIGNDHFLRARCLNYRNHHPGIFVFPPGNSFVSFYHRQRTFVGTGFGNCGSAVGNFIGNHRFINCYSDAMVKKTVINRTRFGLPEYLKSFQWLRAVITAGIICFRMVDFDQRIGEICLDNREKKTGKLKLLKLLLLFVNTVVKLIKKLNIKLDEITGYIQLLPKQQPDYYTRNHFVVFQRNYTDLIARLGENCLYSDWTGN